MRRSRNEPILKEISEDTLDKLYDAAMAIKNGAEESDYKSVLFSSMDNREATLEAAIHIGYFLVQLKKKILIVNFDSVNNQHINEYLELNKGVDLISQLRHSAYISESIARSQYENLDLMGIEEISEDEFATIANHYNLKNKLKPLTNYYDLMIVIGPEADTFNYYANIMEITDCAITVVNSRKNNKKALKSHLEKFEVFNIRSFGIIRKDG